MLSNMTLAEAIQAEAAQRPLAGSGVGAFMHDGAGTGYASETAVALARPRIKSAAAVISGETARAGSVGVGVGAAAHTQINQMTLVRPVTKGGLGPHPAREPDPV